MLFFDYRGTWGSAGEFTFSNALEDAARAVDLVRNAWCRPEMTEETGIEIDGGRHPVVERWLEGEQFVPNDAWVPGSPPSVPGWGVVDRLFTRVGASAHLAWSR